MTTTATDLSAAALEAWHHVEQEQTVRVEADHRRRVEAAGRSAVQRLGRALDLDIDDRDATTQVRIDDNYQAGTVLVEYSGLTFGFTVQHGSSMTEGNAWVIDRCPSCGAEAWSAEPISSLAALGELLGSQKGGRLRRHTPPDALTEDHDNPTGAWCDGITRGYPPAPQPPRPTYRVELVAVPAELAEVVAALDADGYEIHSVVPFGQGVSVIARDLINAEPF